MIVHRTKFSNVVAVLILVSADLDIGYLTLPIIFVSNPISSNIFLSDY